MATPSSILKSAASTQQKIRDYNDSLAAYQWENSSKSYADYVDYEQYLQSQQSTGVDAPSQLSYQKKIDSARSAFISNEVQRQSIDVIEGNTSNVDKYNRMTDLYYYAANAGQDDLAQSMRLQLDNLSVTIQNEQKAQIASNKEGSAQLAKTIDAQVSDAVSQVKDNAKYAVEQYSALGPEKFQQATGSDIFSMLSNMVNSRDPNNPGLVQIYSQASQMSPDPTKVRGYQMQFNDLANGGSTGIKLPGVGEVSYKDLADQAYAQSIGETMFDTIDTGNGIEFTKNQTTGFAWGRDENGNYKLMPIYNAKQNFASGVADPKKQGQNLDYNTLLKNAGFEVTQNGNSLVVRNNGEFDASGVPRGQQVQLYVDKSGNLQAVNGDKAYSLGFDTATGKYTGLKAETPNPINLLGDQFNNRFMSTQDLSKLPGGTIGTIDTTSPFAKFMEGGPLGLQHPQLQSAGSILPPPVPSIQAPTQNVQQTATGQSLISAPANATINIAKPQPLPTITIAKPQPLPSISTQAPTKPASQVKVTVKNGGYSGPGISF